MIDISNIHQYSKINLQGQGDFNPLIIWTFAQKSEIKYRSVTYSEFCNESEKKEFECLVEQLIQSKTLSKDKDFDRNLSKLIDNTIPYTKESLSKIKNYIFQKMIQE